ncbi:MAG: c-type cytochrome biogenesis protein CcsB [Aquificae bacterium]|nr:c-type cytochrome biogenesis protein CcsB [Aquificota bacterium]
MQSQTQVTTISIKAKTSFIEGVIVSLLVLTVIAGITATAILTQKFGNVIVFQISGAIYVLAAALYIVHTLLKNEKIGKLATLTTFTAWVIQTAGLFIRGIESYQLGIFHPPWSNLYESLMFFPWLAVAVYMFIEKEFRTKVIGTFVIPIIAFLIIWGHKFNTDISPLVPALRSYWLYLHVLTSFIGYAGFTVAFGAAFAYLIKENEKVKVSPFHILGFFISLAVLIPLGYIVLNGAKDLKTMLLGAIFLGVLLLFIYFATYTLKFVAKYLPSKNLLSDVTLKAVAISFPIWTAAIILGGAWANEAWGSYWSWDPKENWALIVWLFFAAYIHGRTIGKWQGKTAAWIVVSGFIMLLICYFGVNLYFPGLHSYATE